MLWHQQYLRCCEELSQWEPISEYARQTEHYTLLLDCLWRHNEWHTLKQEVLPKAQACGLTCQTWPATPGPLTMRNSQVGCGIQCVF